MKAAEKVQEIVFASDDQMAAFIERDDAMQCEVRFVMERPDWWKRLGRNIRMSRLDLGMSQKDLGEQACGLRQTYISNLERGLRPHHPLDVVWIAKALELTIDEILNKQLYPGRRQQ